MEYVACSCSAALEVAHATLTVTSSNLTESCCCAEAIVKFSSTTVKFAAFSSHCFLLNRRTCMFLVMEEQLCRFTYVGVRCVQELGSVDKFCALLHYTIKSPSNNEHILLTVQDRNGISSAHELQVVHSTTLLPLLCPLGFRFDHVSANVFLPCIWG